MHRKVVGGTAVAAGLAAAAIAGLGVVGAAGKDGVQATQAPARFVDVDVFAEVNATDGDAALQMRLSAEQNWRRVTLTDPRGRRLFELGSSGSMRRQGLVAFSLESGERTFDELSLSKFKARFPRGRYTFRGTTATGRRIVGSARLSHAIPAGARITFPAADATVDPAGLVIRWEGVTRPRGIDISGYDVLVAGEETDREVHVALGPGARTFSLPAGFLEPNTAYIIEVIARARSGNQSMSEIGFKTRA